MSHKTVGTKEWAYRNLNIQKGCFNNCSYCYAKRMAKRFERINKKEEWKQFPEIKIKKIHKGYRKIEKSDPDLYDYMFPTSHDIFPENLYYVLKVLKKVLGVGNSVLITTKPNLYCTKTLVKKLSKWKDQICFRFTITSIFDEHLKTYEQNAPRFIERYKSLKEAYNNGFKTSISIEPFLDFTPLKLIHTIEPYVINTIWIGIMSGKVPEELKENFDHQNLKDIYSQCKNLPSHLRDKIRFKDSIVNKLHLQKNYFPSELILEDQQKLDQRIES